METPHTAEQIGALWTAYHIAKSQSSTSKIYLSATIPTPTYRQLISKVAAYPCFILPLPRPDAQVESAPDAADTARGPPHEFYFMQWSVHAPPPTPSLDSLPPLFNQPSSSSSQSVPNPPCTTVLFTSLQEYKLRQDYATPHLILTHHTDLAQSHGLVLFRGELTPSPSGQSAVLSATDAQRLASLLQQFYLPPQENDKRGATRAKLLQQFHEEPEAFRWEDVVGSVVF
jgi:ATP synthase mitochondrial F1 complex assembly factor 1